MATQLPTPSKTTTSNEHHRKIRDSCNNCSAQKIRCGKQRPACARCVTKKLECNYSYSQRTGRRSSSMNSAILDGPAALDDPSAMFGSSRSLTTTSLRQAQALTASIETPLSFDPTPFDEPSLFTDLNFNFLSTPPSTTEIAPSSTSSNTNTETTEAAQFVDPEAVWHSLPTSTPELNFEALKAVSSHPVFDQDHVAAFQKSLEKTNQRGHDCMALALQVVNDLSVMREPCIVATSNPMTCIESQKPEIRDVDTVLFMNRDAAQSVKKILNCPCFSDQTVSLACYLATSKIVDWYGAAIEAVGEQSEESNRYTEKTPSHKSSQGAMAERIVARPIYMGKYCPDHEVQRVVRGQVVLGELKEHVQPLLNLLPRFHVTGLEADDDSGSNNLQACVLRNQLRTVIQNAKDLNRSG